MTKTILICFFLSGLTLMIYWPAGHFDILFFDDSFFVKNPSLALGLTWQGAWWAMTSTVATNWHPITNFSFLLMHRLFGYNPGAEHVVNVVFHTVNAALMFLALVELTGARWRSAMVAAIFAWHPLRVESVAWIAERKDVLYVFFLLLCLICYARYAKFKQELRHWQAPPLIGTYTLALLFFVLSLMSKPTAVTLPFLLLLLDFWPLGRFKRSTVRILLAEKIPFVALVVVVSGLTFWIHKSHADVRSLGRFGVEQRLDNTVLSYVLYLGKLVWPTKLAVIYPYPTSFNGVEVLEAGLLLLAISALCFEQRKRRPYLAMGWFWYLGTMVPVIGLVQVGWQAMADRHTYFPLVGPVVSLTWLVAEWAESVTWRKYVAVGTAIAALVACVILTRVQLGYWQNTVTLFRRTIAVTPGNFIAETDLGAGLESEGFFKQAAVHDRIAIGLSPFLYQLHYQLGQCLGRAGYIQAALEEFRMSVSQGWIPDDDLQCMAVAGALTQAGDYGKADELFEAALALNPNSVDALNDLAWNLSACPEPGLRDGAQAVMLAERACELTGYKKTIIMGTLAAAYAEAGRFDEAVEMANRTIENAHSKGEKALEQKNRQLLELYLAHKAYPEETIQK